MKFFGVLLLVALASAAPTSKEEDGNVVITREFFPEQLKIYSSDNDIEKIYVPLNALNFDEDSEDDDTNDDTSTTLFFVETDSSQGKKEYKGLYVLKAGHATKLLEDGRDITATNDQTTTVFFGAKDGLYSYNADKNTAEKYGTLTESIVDLSTKGNNSDVLYVLTEDHEFYKVTNDGTKKEKIEEVKNAVQFVLDDHENIYYFDTDNKVFVANAQGVTPVTGLPDNPKQLTLINPPFVVESEVPIIVDDKAYMISSNGTAVYAEFQFTDKPSAYSMEATLIQYYAFEKNIYEYNILALILGDILEEVKKYLDGMKDSIQSISTRSRSEMHAR